jgi:putative nucleotidyltransferase with HDIG domain
MSWSGGKGSSGPKKHQSVTDFLFTRAKMHWWLLGIIFILAVTWIAFPMEDRRKLLNPDNFKLGDKSPRDVFAQVDVIYHDEAATEERKQKALTEMPPVFGLDFQRLEDAKEEFKIVRQVRANHLWTDAEKAARMKRLLLIGLILEDEVGLILTTATDDQIDDMEKGVIQVLSDILAKGVVRAGEDGGGFAEELSRIDYIKPKWERIRQELERQTGRKPANTQIAAKMDVTLVDTRSDPADEKTVPVEELLLWFEATNAARDMAEKMPEPISTVVEEMCVYLMRPNLIYNPVLTQNRRAEEQNSISLVKQSISKGDKIIGIGETVTESVKGKLETIYSAQKRAIVYAIPGAALLTALLSLMLVVYLKKYEPSIFSEPRKIVALNITILLILALGNLVIIWGPALKIDRPGFLIPTALASILVAILANVQLAIVVTCIIGVFVAMLAGVNLAGSLEYFLVILAGGTVAAISSTRARHRKHLMVAGAYVSAANVTTILGLGLLESVSLVKLGTNCLIGAVNGVTVAILTPGLLPIFEYLSRTTTDMELLELSDLNQPLLTQLKEKASGSYYHSIDVAKLAEAAAEAVGANPLLTRVGSYYHDIGKMTNPEYFIENQKGENVHDTLKPSMSARVIANHIKEGVRIAKEHKLPQVVVDMIQQHVGTTLIGGQRFYQKALEADRHNTVRIEDYRYSGPKPRTKEAAIILLADSVESAARVVLRDHNPTYSRLVSFVREIMEGKMMDFQLDECDFTLRDISSITDAFVRVLSGMYHTRIDYPKVGTTAPVGAEGSATEERSSGGNR